MTKNQVGCKKDYIKNLEGHVFYGLNLDAEQEKFRDAIWNSDYKIVFCNSRAGTGKTFIATAVGNLLYHHRDYDGIVYIVSPYGENKQGFLPGDITKKSEVYYEPFYQALITCHVDPFKVINNESQVSEKNKYPDDVYIRCFTHTYLRGVNLAKKIVIIDEAQNFTLDDLKKTLTRCSDDCKIVVIGHDGQIDLLNKSRSGFYQYLTHFENEPYCCVCNLTKNYRGEVSTHADSITEV